MSADDHNLPELTCQMLIEEVTNYLEGALSADERIRFEAHLLECPPCNEYIEQVRISIRVAGLLCAEGLSELERRRLLNLFRHWQHSNPH